MMRIVMAAGLAAGLAGCASTASVLAEEPTTVYQSARSVNEVAFCLANKNNTPALEPGDGSRVVLIKNGYGGVSLAFSIFPDGEGSRIEYRRKFGTVGGIWRQCVIDSEAEEVAG